MYEMFDTDTKSEKDGVWVDYGEFRTQLARAGGANKLFQRTLELKSRPYRRAIQTETIDVETANRILRETYVVAVVRDWQVKVNGEWQQGIHAEDGSVLSFTKDNVTATYERLPELFDEHREMASKTALYRATLREEGAKNSSGVSSTP